MKGVWARRARAKPRLTGFRFPDSASQSPPRPPPHTHTLNTSGTQSTGVDFGLSCSSCGSREDWEQRKKRLVQHLPAFPRGGEQGGSWGTGRTCQASHC